LLRPTSWLEAFVQWCEAELAWAREDWNVAELKLLEMRDTALRVEHEQLACRAHVLLVQVLERQGRFMDALDIHRSLRRRELRVAAEQLNSRESVAALKLGVRQSEHSLEQALAASRQFERWSLEDALTGIANRRCLERRLEELLTASVENGKPLTVALLDIDRFKSVNDRLGHLVGDRVLKTLAAVFASQVREQDLLARWAGDEFIVLLDDADEMLAESICERIRGATATFAWDSIAPGLQMSVSIGLSRARPGDTVESILRRSDKLMYGSKRGPMT
jgi:diguanylate cyclase (GGDEF)-like protein